jgi:hypothetical protein
MSVVLEWIWSHIWFWKTCKQLQVQFSPSQDRGVSSWHCLPTLPIWRLSWWWIFDKSWRSVPCSSHCSQV